MKIRFADPVLTVQDFVDRASCADKLQLLLTDDWGHMWATARFPEMTRSEMSNAKPTASWRMLLNEPAEARHVPEEHMLGHVYHAYTVITVHAQPGTVIDSLRSALLRKDWTAVENLYKKGGE